MWEKKKELVVTSTFGTTMLPVHQSNPSKPRGFSLLGHTPRRPQMVSFSMASALSLQNRMLPLKDLILEDRVRISMAHKSMPPKPLAKEATGSLSDGMRHQGITKKVSWKLGADVAILRAPPPTPEPPEGTVIGRPIAQCRESCYPCICCYRASVQANTLEPFRRKPISLYSSSVKKPASLYTARRKRKSDVPSTPLFRRGFSTLSLRALHSADQYHQALNKEAQLSQKKSEVKEKVMERRSKTAMSSAQMSHHQRMGEELEEQWRRHEVEAAVGSVMVDVRNDYLARKAEYRRIQVYGTRESMKASRLLGQRIALANRAIAK